MPLKSIPQCNSTTEFFPQPLAVRANQSFSILAPFLSDAQERAIENAIRNGNRTFMERVVSLANTLETMPDIHWLDASVYSATAFFHYSSNEGDWYITGLSANGDADQAWGYIVLRDFESCGECGYISIRDLIQGGAFLDYWFIPCTLAELNEEKGKCAA